jgi:hypothetical protein
MEEKVIKISSEDTEPNYLYPAMCILQKPICNDIIFIIKDKEMLRITPDGFFVEGRSVPVDENHDKVIYDTIKEICLRRRNG